MLWHHMLRTRNHYLCGTSSSPLLAPLQDAMGDHIRDERHSTLEPPTARPPTHEAQVPDRLEKELRSIPGGVGGTKLRAPLATALPERCVEELLQCRRASEPLQKLQRRLVAAGQPARQDVSHCLQQGRCWSKGNPSKVCPGRFSQAAACIHGNSLAAIPFKK